jgi:hypothetical protein
LLYRPRIHIDPTGPGFPFVSQLFDEVDEDVRRDQLKRLWDKYSFLIVGLAVLIVAAVAGWRGYQYLETKKSAEAGAAFDRAVELSEQDKPAEAEAAFLKLAQDAPAGYRILARLRAAAEAGKRDPNEAVKQYDAIAGDSAIGPAERDLARVRAGSLLVDSAGYDALASKVEPATAANGAFRHTARELLALSAWKAGNSVAARQWVDMISNDPTTPASMRSRSEALQALLPPAAKS